MLHISGPFSLLWMCTMLSMVGSGSYVALICLPGSSALSISLVACAHYGPAHPTSSESTLRAHNLS